MPTCCVPFCRSRPAKGSGIPFHEFPIDKELRERWLKCISREGTQFVPNDKSNSSLVCGLHFKDGDYRFSLNGSRTNKLNKNAYPTRYLNSAELGKLSLTSDRTKTSKDSNEQRIKTASRICKGKKRPVFYNEMGPRNKKKPTETSTSKRGEKLPTEEEKMRKSIEL
ncbi:hypothetical protein J437_LFUL016723 [Ladona fulva]|uniref:THAP-type domain-containing protein n=1 Tax=Ladona fulva TaxID=123851 RepID=A0A8K0KK16_LADFU|nr:hypothetical protein J437_LFUL016723 [Ladona fulva]